MLTDDEKNINGKAPSITSLAIRQALLIAHMDGLLWLKRYPASIVFIAMIPFSFLFIVFVIGGVNILTWHLQGALVSAAASYGMATGNSIINWKVEYKTQDLFISSPVSSFTYMAGLALGELLFGLPAFAILATLVVVFSSDFLYSVPLVLSTLILVWALSSSIGYFISTRSTHPRFVESFVAFLRIAIVVLPPVFYPLSVVPTEELRYLTYAIPTTHASLILQNAMGVSSTTPEEWSLGFGFSVIIAYTAGFALLAKTKAAWREG